MTDDTTHPNAQDYRNREERAVAYEREQASRYLVNVRCTNYTGVQAQRALIHAADAIRAGAHHG